MFIVQTGSSEDNTLNGPFADLNAATAWLKERAQQERDTLSQYTDDELAVHIAPEGAYAYVAAPGMEWEPRWEGWARSVSAPA